MTTPGPHEQATLEQLRALNTHPRDVFHVVALKLARWLDTHAREHDEIAWQATKRELRATLRHIATGEP